MAKYVVRLLLRRGISDADGKLAEYRYATVIVEIEAEAIEPTFGLVTNRIYLPEIIGAEWLEWKKAAQQ